MTTPTIQVDEWLAELDRLAQETAQRGAVTVAELTEVTGRSEGWVRKRLLALKRDGRLEVVQVKRETLIGRLASVLAYRIKPAQLTTTTKTKTKGKAR